jgi:hypothetical protein
MVNLDDTDCFTRVLLLDVPWAHTYADTTVGKTDLDRREKYRAAALGSLLPLPTNTLWWAFRITVAKTGRQLDLDNVPKTIIDAFCARQIIKDGSQHTELGLYTDDSLDHIRIVQLVGAPSDADGTRIEIFACTADPVAGQYVSAGRRSDEVPVGI